MRCWRIAHWHQMLLFRSKLRSPVYWVSHSMTSCKQEILNLRDKRAKLLEDKGDLKSFSLEEVQLHNTKDSGWIIVDSHVYDISQHVINHAGWTCGCAVSTLEAILRTLGTDCTDEVFSSHSDTALESIQYFLIGKLKKWGNRHCQLLLQSISSMSKSDSCP